MCGRFTLSSDLKALAKRFSAALPLATARYSPRYNIAPTQNVIVVQDDGKRCLKQMRWGLIPSWAKDPSIGNRIINARCETLAAKPAFRMALRKRRCLVLADGFYEWRKLGSEKQPVRIILRSKQPFAFAGLWDCWTSPQGEQIQSCTIITTAANRMLHMIHDRMPAILPKDDESVWLDPKITEPSILLPLLKPYPSGEMQFYAVSKNVNVPAHDTPDCIVPVEPA